MADIGIQVTARCRRAHHRLPHRPPNRWRWAPDRSQGDVPVKWELESLRQRTDRHLHPVHAQLDRASVPSGAALWVRVVTVEQAAAFAQTMAMAPAAAGQQSHTAPAADVRVGQRQLR